MAIEGAQCVDFQELSLSPDKFDCVVIGPEVPLAEGMADQLRQKGLNVFGPSQSAARLEASKIFAKEFMEAAGVPTAKHTVVKSVDETLAAVAHFQPPFVLKADGLAAGKGVFICKDELELREAAQKIFVEKVLGVAGETAMLEQFQPGYELSYLILTDGQTYQSLPLAQDHKRLFDGDRGPNTGGMGTVAPLAVDPALHERIHREILQPTVAMLSERKMLYRGVVFLGLMITDQGPMVLEYNVRFGDPETQVLLPLLDGDWADVFISVAKGRVPSLHWKAKCAAACVVLAAEGYPDHPVKGAVIEGDLSASSHEGYFLHAGTKAEGSVVKVNGGRVLNALGVGTSVSEAVTRAYAQAERIQWPGRQMRRDIGAKVLR